MLRRLKIHGQLEEKIAALSTEMGRLKTLEAQMLEAPDQQLSLTDPNSRSMKTRGTGVVGYNVQLAVDTDTHLIVTHDVINDGSDRQQLSPMATKAKEVLQP